MAIAAKNDLEIHHLDIKAAYLSGKIDKEVYMRQPPSFHTRGKEHLVCRLRKKHIRFETGRQMNMEPCPTRIPNRSRFRKPSY